MPHDDPRTTGPTLEELLESVLFADPATHTLRAEWERTKAEEQATFERVCQEEYEGRKMYHEICRTPNPEAEAWREVDLVRPLLKEELDTRLAERWSIVLRKIQAVLADKHSESGEDSNTGSASGTGDSCGT